MVINKEKIALVIPFWNIEEQAERCENLQFAINSLKNYVNFHNSKDDGKFHIDLIPVNLGKYTHPVHSDCYFIEHNLKYRYDKPTRLNSLYSRLYDNYYAFVGMCDPDIIIFNDNYDSLFNSINDNLNHDTMLTYGISRTKPELRNYLDLENHTIDNLKSHPLINEASEHPENWGLCGGVYFMSLNKYIELGGFNEEFRVYGFDDDEYTFRFKLNGYKVLEFPDITWYHLWHPTVLGGANDIEIVRYEYECQYIRNLKNVYYKQIELSLEKRTDKLNHITPSFLYKFNYNKSSTINQHPFSYDIGRRSIDLIPITIQNKIGLRKNETFYF